MRETIISIDVEADGPIPGLHSMLNLGAAAFDADGKELGAFSVNLLPLEGAHPDPGSLAWWAQQSRAVWEAIRANPQPPEAAMRDFVSWLMKFERPVFLASPVGYDFTYVRWYLCRFVGQLAPNGRRLWHNAIDLRSYAMAVLKTPYGGPLKERIRAACPEFSVPPHTHLGLDDAREQAAYFFALKRLAAKRAAAGGSTPPVAQ